MSATDRGNLRKADGVHFLLHFLRSSIGGTPAVDVGKYMERYFFSVKREKGESMSNYLAREGNTYNDFCKSILRM